MHNYLARKLNILIVMLLFLLCSCCTTSKYTPNQNTADRALMSYLEARTVLVERVCLPGVGARSASGSGVILDSRPGQSRIVTAEHLLNERCTLFVTRGSGDSVKATVLIKDSGTDLAILAAEANYKVDTKLELYPYRGQKVLAIGYPFQFRAPGEEHLSITSGVIATLNLPAEKGTLLRITADIYYGNSGGGLFSREGKLAGINVSMSLVSVPGSLPIPRPGYYYSSPSKNIVELLSKLKEK